MDFLIDYIKGNNKSSKNVVIIEKPIDNPTENLTENLTETDIVITTSKFNKDIDEIEDNKFEKEIEEEDNKNESEGTDDLEDDFETKFGQDSFKNYINVDSIRQFTKNGEFCTFNWNGIELLDKWELQRKVDMNHATVLAIAMLRDYKKYKEFVFYDPIHIGKKKDDDKYYVLDGQHRLEAYSHFYKKNKYPIQQIPIIVWYVDTEDEFIELFQKINNRLSLDKLKLMQMKLLEIFEGLEHKYGKTMWGANRPKINKDIFANKLKSTDSVHKLTTEQILFKLIEINEKIRVKPRSSRVKPNVNTSIHNSAESMDFFLGLDKTMAWLSEFNE